MHQRGADHPDQIASPAFFFPHAGRQLLIVHRAFAADLGGHEAEFIGSVGTAQETPGMNHDALSAILRLPHGNELASLESTRLDRLQKTTPLHHDAIHARTSGGEPLAVDPDVGWEIGGREEPFREHAVRRQWCKARVRCPGERRLTEIGGCRGSGGCVHTGEKLGEHQGVFKHAG